MEEEARYDQILEFIGIDSIIEIRRGELIWGIKIDVKWVDQYSVTIEIEFYDRTLKEIKRMKFLVFDLDTTSDSFREKGELQRSSQVMERLISNNLDEQINPQDPLDRRNDIYFVPAIEAAMAHFGFTDIDIEEIDLEEEEEDVK
ncbi:MAG: hypothetical protein HQK77_07690 [Desulfobacterales bacterium]|nr:hypothetical protein [Desulfobacterales bacterium]